MLLAINLAQISKLKKWEEVPDSIFISLCARLSTKERCIENITSLHEKPYNERKDYLLVLESKKHFMPWVEILLREMWRTHCRLTPCINEHLPTCQCWPEMHFYFYHKPLQYHYHTQVFRFIYKISTIFL